MAGSLISGWKQRSRLHNYYGHPLEASDRQRPTRFRLPRSLFRPVLFAFYTNSISPSAHGSSYELYGIAAAVLGGCSLRGGEGSILGVILGTALLQVLQNLVNLLGIQSSLNFAVVGTVILIGVVADRLLRRRS